MTQHTQPVVAAQHQNQQQQHQQQTSTAQQQNTTTPNSNNNNNNNNAINNNNNNNTNSTPTTTNNNQTQTVAVQQQQHQNNNNNNNSYQNATGGQMFNPQLQSANVYVPAHPHHHPQPHHHQAGAMYQTMIPAAIPSNVFVNNVTANVNLHGWPHTVPHGTWVPAGSAPQYLHGELPPEQGAPVIQPLGAMPLTIPAPNALAGPVVNPNPTVITGGTRGSRKGQGRGGSSGSRRGDYNIQRHPPPEGSPAPQQAGQNNQQDIQQPGQQPADAQQMMTTLQPSYVQHPQYPYPYGYGYPTYFASQQHMIHPGQSTAAQHATGTPLYFQPMPVYNGPHMYNYGYYVSQLINQTDYPYGEEVGVGDDRAAAAGDGGMMWPQQHIYADEYAMGAGPDMHAVPSDDINHNASSIGSANETPNLLSPNFTPMYEQMTQQMGVMQIYDDPQMGQMHVMHRQGAVQMDDEISECGSQPSMQIVAPQPIQIVPAAAVSPMSLTANSNEQILQQQQQQTPHLIPVSGDNIMPTDSSLTNNNTTTPQQQIQQQQQSIIGDHTDDGTSQRYDHVAHNAKKLDANFNEETVQSTDDNLTKQEYEQLLPTEQMLQQQQIEMQEIEKQKSYDYNNQNIIQDLIESNSKKFGENVQSSDDNLKKKELEPQLPTEQMLQQQQIEMQEMEEQKSYNNSYNKIMQDLKDLNSKRYKNTTDVAIETVATNVVTNRQQQQSQQQTQDRPHKQQPQQYVSKQNVPQETQQYQHQQLQTQPITPVAQQQPIHHQKSNQQQQQPQHHHHQTSNQQQQQQHHNSQQQQQPQQSYENRKSSQMYNQQHQLRNRKYDYHYNDGSSHHQQQQSQQQTKTMSWTNSSQHKKSTNTVGVTATPTSSHSSSVHNKSSNATNTSSTHTHGSRSYYQHHTNYQQQNYHYQQQQQQQQHQPTTRNHAAMKMPSSPISSGPNTMERKTSQSSDAGKQTQQQTTSTASTTAAPHQFQQQQPQQSQQTSTNDMVSTQQTSVSTAVSSGTTTSSISSKQSQQHQQQQSQHNPPGFATKKHSLSNQGHSSSSFGTNSSTASTATSNPVETSNTPAINLAPPVTAQTTSVAPSTPSWASLFASNTNASSSNSSNTSASANNSLAAASNSSSTSSGFTKKPIAKVAPYEGITPVTPPPPVVTPGTLSYSAASAQNLPPSTNNSTTAAKKSSTSLSSEQQSQRNSLANLDEYSLKFAEFLTKYKSDWAPISLRPRGLTNRSNYCYINSILQALLGCSPLYNLIRSIPKQAANLCEVKTPTVNAMMTFMSNFSNLPTGLRLRTTKGGKGNKDDLGGDLQCDPAFEPTEIYKLWNDSREEHVEGRQEDAEEFLSYILNKLNDEMLEVIKLIAKPNPEQNGQNEPPEEDGDVWQVISNNRNKGSVTRQTDFGCTPLSDIFRGELRSRLQREGEHSTDVIQPFFTLQLNIEKAASVKEALEILVGRDQLEGVTGSKSKQEVVAWQQMNLEKLPPILILHLKWFDYRSDGCTKILKKVEFPVELKIDTKILASKNYSQKKRAYRLFAVVYHDGKEATKGHYITDVYHTGYGSWLRYDDSSVKPVSENHVLLPRTPRVPYLLCYRRCDTIPQQSNNNQNNNNSSGNTQSSTGK